MPSAFAGPSEVVVVADGSAPADYAALDLVVQAEHGPDGLAWLVSWSEEVAEAVEQAVERFVAESPAPPGGDRDARPRWVVGARRRSRPGDGRLQRGGPRTPRTDNRRPRAAGPTGKGSRRRLLWAVGTRQRRGLRGGPSHVLPTARSARFSSALGTQDFLKRVPRREARPRGGPPGRPPRCRDRSGGRSRRARRVGNFPGEPDLPPVAPLPPRWPAVTRQASPARTFPEPRADLGCARATTRPRSLWRCGSIPTNRRTPRRRSSWRLLSPQARDIAYNRYPDRSARALREALAELHGVEADQVFAANGSTRCSSRFAWHTGAPGEERRCSSRLTLSIPT